MWSSVSCVLLLAALSHAGPAGLHTQRHHVYKGYSVEAVYVSNERDQQLVQRLEDTLGLEVWDHGTTAGEVRGARPRLLMVAGGRRGELAEQLDQHRIQHHTHIQDVASAFSEFDSSLSRYRAARGHSLKVFEDYPRHEQVNEYLESLATDHPDIVRVITAGQSYEGRDIKYLQISTSNFTDSSKPVIFFQAMIHAREWLTTPVVLYAAHQLVTSRGALLERADYILLPVVNPDGYEYSHDEIRLWRKTRSVVPELTGVDEGCVGADGNRNYDVMFNTLGVSVYHCSDTFPGVSAFSEPETRLSRDIMLQHAPAPQGSGRMQLFVDVHSHGSWVLFSWGNSSLPPNAPLLLAAGSAMAAAMDARKLPEGAYYTAGNSASLLYATSGTASDYAQSVGTPLSFTLELPNYGRDFRVPPEYIGHVTAETWAGLSAAVQIAITTYNGPNTRDQ